MAVRIGELLLKEKRITPAQLQEALNYQKTNGGKLGFNLVKLGFVKDEEITALLSKQYGVPSINLTQFEIDPVDHQADPAETAQKYQIVPLSRAGRDADDRDDRSDQRVRHGRHQVHDGLQRRAGRRVRDGGPRRDHSATTRRRRPPAARRSRREEAGKQAPPPQQANLNSAATLEMVTKALEETTAAIVDDDVELLEELEQIDVASLEKQGGEAPVIRLVNLMLMSAIQKGASDIHIEPYEKEFRVRFRIDGILYNVMAPPMKFRDAITSRIKIMAKLDIAEKRLPQDGRIKIRFADRRRHQGDRLPRLVPADALRREDRHASARQGQADARHDEARLRARVAEEARGRDRQAVGHGARDRPDRQRQDEHALLVDREDQHDAKPTS